MPEEFEFLSPEKAVLAEQLCEEQADLNAEITRLEYKRQEWLSKPKGSDMEENFREVTVRIIEATYIFHVNVENDDATMEVTAERRMLQLYAPHNSEPSESVRKLAFKWAKANAIDVTDCNRRD